MPEKILKKGSKNITIRVPDTEHLPYFVDHLSHPFIFAIDRDRGSSFQKVGDRLNFPQQSPENKIYDSSSELKFR